MSEIEQENTGTPTVHVSLKRRTYFNGDSIEVLIGISQMPVGASEEDIAKAIETVELSFDALRTELARRWAAIKAKAKDKGNEQ